MFFFLILIFLLNSIDFLIDFFALFGFFILAFVLLAILFEALISLNKEDTTIGDIINTPIDYWYEVQLNPETNPQTIIGYDENGAKIFRLYPEGVEEE